MPLLLQCPHCEETETIQDDGKQFECTCGTVFKIVQEGDPVARFNRKVRRAIKDVTKQEYRGRKNDREFVIIARGTRFEAYWVDDQSVTSDGKTPYEAYSDL